MPDAGVFVKTGSFTTNSQTDLSKFTGTYIAASESYESNYKFEITQSGNALNIIVTYSYTMDGGDNWNSEATKFSNVSVDNGYFYIGLYENEKFRFVTGTYKPYDKKKKVTVPGIVMEEYKLFAEKTD